MVKFCISLVSYLLPILFVLHKPPPYAYVNKTCHYKGLHVISRTNRTPDAKGRNFMLLPTMVTG